MHTAIDKALLDNDQNSVGNLISTSELLLDATFDSTMKYEVQDDSFVHTDRYSNNILPVTYAETQHFAKNNTSEDKVAECIISVRALTGNTFRFE